VFEIGTSLREARVRQGVDLAEAEQGTKVRSKYLRALEDERFDQLPGHTYVKGFLRAYAEYLGLDGQLYVDEYNSRFVTGEEETPLRSRRTSRTRVRPDTRPLVIALAAIVVVTALVIAAFRFGGPGKNGEKAFRPPAATRHHVSTKPQHKRVHHTRARKRAAAPAKVARVTLTAAYGASWLRVHRVLHGGREQLLYTGTVEQGKTLPFSGPQLRVELGRPANVLARLNGRRAALPPGDAPRTVVVTPQRIAAAPA
jgi:cytoskeleton protein RodZ